MNGYPQDMFAEMDEIFNHLFARMQDNFMTGNPEVSGFRIVIDSPGANSPGEHSPAPHPRNTANPPVEVHRIDSEIKIIAELPGATSESIRIDVQGQTLVIDAVGIDAPYHTTADLPPVEAGSLQSTFRNGVLEVTLRAVPEEP
jgi:HSP20 family molecular chaperone IbpA